MKSLSDQFGEGMYQPDRPEVVRSFINISLRRMGDDKLSEPLMVAAAPAALLAEEADHRPHFMRKRQMSQSTFQRRE